MFALPPWLVNHIFVLITCSNERTDRRTSSCENWGGDPYQDFEMKQLSVPERANINNINNNRWLSVIHRASSWPAERAVDQAGALRSFTTATPRIVLDPAKLRPEGRAFEWNLNISSNPKLKG